MVLYLHTFPLSLYLYIPLSLFLHTLLFLPTYSSLSIYTYSPLSIYTYSPLSTNPFTSLYYIYSITFYIPTPLYQLLYLPITSFSLHQSTPYLPTPYLYLLPPSLSTNQPPIPTYPSISISTYLPPPFLSIYLPTPLFYLPTPHSTYNLLFSKPIYPVTSLYSPTYPAPSHYQICEVSTMPRVPDKLLLKDSVRIPLVTALLTSYSTAIHVRYLCSALLLKCNSVYIITMVINIYLCLDLLLNCYIIISSSGLISTGSRYM